MVSLYLSGKPIDPDQQKALTERFKRLFSAKDYNRNISILNLIKLSVKVWHTPFEEIFQPDMVYGIIDTRHLSIDDRKELQAAIQKFIGNLLTHRGGLLELQVGFRENMRYILGRKQLTNMFFGAGAQTQYTSTPAGNDSLQFGQQFGWPGTTPEGNFRFAKLEKLTSVFPRFQGSTNASSSAGSSDNMVEIPFAFKFLYLMQRQLKVHFDRILEFLFIIKRAVESDYATIYITPEEQELFTEHVRRMDLRKHNGRMSQIQFIHYTIKQFCTIYGGIGEVFAELQVGSTQMKESRLRSILDECMFFGAGDDSEVRFTLSPNGDGLCKEQLVLYSILRTIYVSDHYHYFAEDVITEKDVALSANAELLELFVQEHNRAMIILDLKEHSLPKDNGYLYVPRKLESKVSLDHAFFYALHIYCGESLRGAGAATNDLYGAQDSARIFVANELNKDVFIRTKRKQPFVFNLKMEKIGSVFRAADFVEKLARVLRAYGRVRPMQAHCVVQDLASQSQYAFSLFVERDGFAGKGNCFGLEQIDVPSLGVYLRDVKMFGHPYAESPDDARLAGVADRAFANSGRVNVVLMFGKSDAQVWPQTSFPWPDDSKNTEQLYMKAGKVRQHAKRAHETRAIAEHVNIDNQQYLAATAKAEKDLKVIVPKARAESEVISQSSDGERSLHASSNSSSTENLESFHNKENQKKPFARHQQRGRTQFRCERGVRHNNFGSRVASECSCSAGPTSPDYNNNNSSNNKGLGDMLGLFGGALELVKQNKNLPEHAKQGIGLLQTANTLIIQPFLRYANFQKMVDANNNIDKAEVFKQFFEAGTRFVQDKLRHPKTREQHYMRELFRELDLQRSGNNQINLQRIAHNLRRCDTLKLADQLNLRSFRHLRDLDYAKLNSFKDNLCMVMRKVTPEVAQAIGGIIQSVRDKQYVIAGTHIMNVVQKFFYEQQKDSLIAPEAEAAPSYTEHPRIYNESPARKRETKHETKNETKKKKMRNR